MTKFKFALILFLFLVVMLSSCREINILGAILNLPLELSGISDDTLTYAASDDINQEVVQITGGVPPYNVASIGLPLGIGTSHDYDTNIIYIVRGVLSDLLPGVYPVTVTAMDSKDAIGSHTLTIVITE